MAIQPVMLVCMLLVAVLAATDETCNGDGCDRLQQPVNDNYANAAKLAHLVRPVTGGTQATVIIVSVSMGYIHFYRNWLIFAMELGFGEKHIVIAEDLEVFQILANDAKLNLKGRIIDPSHQGPDIPDKPHTHGSYSFNLMAGRRPQYILKFLKLGYDVLYSDIDTVWLADPFSHFTDPSVTLFIQSDPENRFDSIDHILCTGYMLLKANDHAIDLMTRWEKALMKEPGSTVNQEVCR